MRTYCLYLPGGMGGGIMFLLNVMQSHTPEKHNVTLHCHENFVSYITYV